MVLHDGGDTEPLVRAVLYPLWDANLKVGHAVRTVAECRDAGLDEFDTLTSLLSARLITGETALFSELTDTITDMVRSRPLAPALVTRERERRDLEPYPTMTADVKESRGALRTHQGFWWERRRVDLIGLDPDEPTVNEDDARASLLRIRNALHAAAGRAEDRFVVDLREAAANWLGTDIATMAASLTAALDTGDRFADRRWPDLHAERDPMIGFGRRIFGAIRTRFTPAKSPELVPDTVLTTAVKAAGRRSGAWFDETEEHLIRGQRDLAWTAADRTAFVMLLTAGERGRTIFGRLVDLGWIEHAFPEWLPIATAPQLAPFHDHPVGAHLWRAADEMHRLITGGGDAGAIAEEVGSTEELLLSAFLHDIGKARGGNHEIVGADLSEAFLRRAGFGPATIGVVVDSVRNHLLLSETATRRDIADRTVIEDVAAVVGDVHRLDVLYLLTMADLMATGTTMWNEWRATLLRTLYHRVRETIGTGTAPPATPDIDAIMDEAPEGTERRAVEEHVAAMPSDYLDATPPAEVLWHMDVADRLGAPALLTVDPADPGRVLVAGRDRAGFLLAVARAFTASGVGVMDARLRTRSDGIALDTFHVRDDRSGGVVPEERWERVTEALYGSLEDQADIRPIIRERVRTYRARDHDPSDVEVRAYPLGRFTAIEIRTPDRIGLLADVVEALHLEGLDVHLAKIDTIGGRARDVFHVRRVGVPIHVESEREALRRRLEDAIRGV